MEHHEHSKEHHHHETHFKPKYGLRDYLPLIVIVAVTLSGK